MGIRALAFDLDGTLLGRDEHVSPRNAAAARAALDAGLEVIVATARWYQLAEQAARELDPSGSLIDGPAIACSGAQVRRLRDGADLLDLRLPSEFVDVLFGICDEHRCIAWAALDDDVIVKMDGSPDSLPPGLRQAPSLVLGAERRRPRMVLVQGSDVCDRIESELPSEWVDRVRFVESISSTGKRLLTLTATGADKGAALAIACADLGIRTDEVIAFGDAENDIEMFRVARYSVAMGQASPDVQASASFVSADNARDGVAVALEQFLEHGEAIFR